MRTPQKTRPTDAERSPLDFLDGPPAYSLDMEREVIGGLLTGDREACEYGFANLEPGDFYGKVLRAMFAALREAWKDKRTWNSPALLVEFLRTSEGVTRIERAQLGGKKMRLKAWCQAVVDRSLPSGVFMHVTALRRLRCERAMRELLAEAMGDAQNGLEPAKWCRKVRNGLAGVERLCEPLNGKANGKVRHP